MKRTLTCLMFFLLAACGVMAQPFENDEDRKDWNYRLHVDMTTVSPSCPGKTIIKNSFNYLYVDNVKKIDIIGLYRVMRDIELSSLSSHVRMWVYNISANNADEYHECISEVKISFYGNQYANNLGQIVGCSDFTLPSIGDTWSDFLGLVEFGITPPKPTTFDVLFNTAGTSYQSTGFVIKDVRYKLEAGFPGTWTSATYYYKTDKSSLWTKVEGDSLKFKEGELNGASIVYVRAYGYRADGDPGIQYSAGYMQKELKVMQLPTFTVVETKACGKDDKYVFTIKPTDLCDSLPFIRVAQKSGPETAKITLSESPEIQYNVDETISTRDKDTIVIMFYNKKEALVHSVSISKVLPINLTDSNVQKTDLVGCPGAKGRIEFIPPQKLNGYTYRYGIDNLPLDAAMSIDVSDAKDYIPYYQATKDTINDKYSYCYPLGNVTIIDSLVSNAKFITTPTNAICYGNTGLINGNLTPMVANPRYYSMVVENNGFDLSSRDAKSSPLKANAYTVGLSYNGNICSNVNRSVTIDQPPQITITPTVVKVDDYGTKTGKISFTIDNGVAPFVVTLNSSDKEPILINSSKGEFSGLLFGTYTITVKDKSGNGCAVTSSAIAVDQPTKALSVSVANQTNVSCFGESSGAVTLNATGGWDYKYQYRVNGDEFQDEPTFSNLKFGDYTFEVIDSMGVIKPVSCSIGQPPQVLSVAVNGIVNVCTPGAKTGKIDYTVTGGNDTYTVTLIPGLPVNGTPTGNSVGSFGELLAQKYVINVVDNKGCLASINAEVMQPPVSKLNADISSTDETLCPSFHNGKVSVAVSGGFSPFTVVLDTLSGKAIRTGATVCFDNLGANVSAYSVLVTDGLGCSFSKTLTIKPAITPTVTLVTKQPCEVGSGPSGWIAPSVNLTGNSLVFSTTNSTGGALYALPGAKFINLTNKKYFIALTIDGKECPSAEKTHTLNPVPKIVASDLSILPTGCPAFAEGSVAVSLTGGAGGDFTGVLTYQDGAIFKEERRATMPSRFAITKLLAREYALALSDTAQCTLPSFNVPVPVSVDAVDLSSAIPTSPTCAGDSDGLIVIEGGKGSGDWTLTLNGPEQQVVTETIPRTVGSVSKTYTRGVGSYTVTLSDATGCSESIPVEVVAKPAITVAAIPRNVTTAQTADGELDFIISGGNGDYTNTLRHSDGSLQQVLTGATGLFTGLAADTYTLSVSDKSQCPGSYLFTVATPPAPLRLQVPVTTNPKCTGFSNGTVNLTATGGWGGYSYTCKEPAAQALPGKFTNLKAGAYTFTVTDLLGATHDTTINLTDPPQLAIASAIPTPVKCHGQRNGVVVFTPTGGTTPYSLMLGTETRPEMTWDGLVAGTYTFALIDVNGCLVPSESIEVKQAATLFTSAIDKITPATCSGKKDGAVAVSVAGGEPGYTFTLDGGESNTTGLFPNLFSRSYSITATDSYGCAVSLDALVGQPTTLNYAELERNSPLCNTAVGLLRVAANGGVAPYAYSWQADSNPAVLDSDSLLTERTAGNYVLTITDAHTCSARFDFALSNPDAMALESIVSIAPPCHGEVGGRFDFLLNGNNLPITVSLLQNNTTKYVQAFEQNQAGSFGPLAAGSYTLEMTDSHNCFASVQNIIAEPASLLLGLTPSAVVCNASATGRMVANLSGGTLPYTVSWSNSAGSLRAAKISAATDTLANLPAETYTAKLTDDHGCPEQASTAVLTDPDPVKPIIPASAILCSNQSILVDAGYHGSDHAWTSTNGFTSNQRSVTISDAGTYTVWVTDFKGCSGSASINLTKLAEDIDADFVVSTSTSVGDTIVLVEFTLPVPDSISWDFPGDAFTLIKRGNNELHIRAEMEGTFPVALTTHMGLCSERFEKPVTVVAALPKQLNQDYYPNPFKEVKLYPNPNEGLFTVEVNLHESAPLEVALYNGQQQKVFYQVFSAADFFTISSDRLSLKPGFYLLNLRAKGQVKAIKMIIQK